MKYQILIAAAIVAVILTFNAGVICGYNVGKERGAADVRDSVRVTMKALK